MNFKKLNNGPKYNVLFYYPRHFNRSINGTNPFIDPLIQVCKENNLKYLVVEEPDKKTDKPRNPQAVKFDFWFFVIQILRKILPQFLWSGFHRRELFIGKIIGILSFNSFKANVYITISNSMISLLPALNKKAKVFDLQHGLIHSEHSGYFEKGGLLREGVRDERIHFLLYGEGYANTFFRNIQNLQFHIRERIKIIGDVFQNNIEILSCYNNQKSAVLYSLQFVQDAGEKSFEIQKNELIEFLESIEGLFNRQQLILLLKHHPRFNNAINLDEINKRFGFVKFTSEPVLELSKTVFLHITQTSTTAFEYASVGIPTWFVPSSLHNLGYKIFTEEYDYPLKGYTLQQLVEIYMRSEKAYFQNSQKVMNWYQYFYSPFKSEAFLEAIKWQ